MDAGQFDRLAKALSAATNRRRLVIGLGASLLAGFVGADLFEPEEAAAKRTRRQAKTQHRHTHRVDQKAKKADRTKHRRDQKDKKRQVTASKKTCRQDGAPCGGRQADRCCEGLACARSGRGSARRCRPSPCFRACAAIKPCGDDGCGGSCGECTAPDSCVDGSCVCERQCAGKECGPDGCGNQCGFCAGPICHDVTCSAAGLCAVSPIAGCCRVAGDCAMNNPCMTDSCQNGMCHQDLIAPGTPCTQSSGNDGLCNADGHCMECLSDADCDDGRACTTNTCQNGVCQSSPLGANTPCARSGGGAGVCTGSGQCVQCLSSASCEDGNPCTRNVCDVNTLTCDQPVTLPDLTSCEQTKSCLSGQCTACKPAAGTCVVQEDCCDHLLGTGGCTSVVPVGFQNVCCRFDGQPCQTRGECCTTSALCQPGAAGSNRCCRPAGLLCTVDSDCCGGSCVGPRPSNVGPPWNGFCG